MKRYETLFPLSLHPQVLASTRYGISFSMIFIAYDITILITINNYINIQLGSILKYDTLTLYIKKYHYLIGQDGNCRHNKCIQFNLDRESVSQNWLADNQFTIIDFICDLEYYS